MEGMSLSPTTTTTALYICAHVCVFLYLSNKLTNDNKKKAWDIELVPVFIIHKTCDLGKLLQCSKLQLSLKAV